MDIRHYRSFIALADERSFTAAARRLNVVQSGLSATIKEMEEELGVLLVNRTTRQVSLTSAGLLFLDYAKTGLTTLSDGVAAVRSESHIVRGRLNLGILQSLGPYLDLPAVLSRFHAAYPEVEFAVRSVDSMRAPELVRSGYVDLSFHAEIDKGRLAGVESIPFTQDALVAVCARTHLLAEQNSVTLEGLTQFPFVDLTPERTLRNFIDKIMADHRVSRKSVYEMSSVATLMQFVSAGLGVSIVPTALARACALALRLHVLPIHDGKPRIPKWRLVLLARPVRLRLPGKTLPELMLDALMQAKRSSDHMASNRKQIAIQHLG